jgi:hypothetical protein
VIVDGSDSNTATISLGYLSTLMDIYGQRVTGARGTPHRCRGSASGTTRN